MSYKNKKTEKIIIETNENNFVLSSHNQVKSSIINKSFKIFDNFGSPIILFSTSEITSFELLDNTILIYTSDEIPFKLLFYTNNDAEFANEKINKIINGEFIL